MSSKKITEKLFFGGRIKDLRNYLKLRQVPFAEKLGIAGTFRTKQVTISRWEKDIRRPDYDYIAKMVELSGVSLAWLLLGKGLMFIEQPSAALSVAETSAPYGELTKEEREIIGILRENPELTGPCRKLLGGRKAFKEALADLQKIPDPSEP